MLVVVCFRVKNRLTIGFVGRRPHKYTPERNVLEAGHANQGYSSG